MGQLTVQEATDRPGLRAFVDYPYAKYRNDPNWVAPLRISQFEMFDESKNPFWQHAQKALYVARRDGRVVGRIAYIRDDEHIRLHDEQLAFFGFFEADDDEAAKALLEVVESHAASEGLGAVRGPINPSMNDGAGFQIDSFDEKPAVMMPQNPPEYPRWVEGAGYAKIKDLYTFEFDTHKPFDERIERIAARTKARYPIVIRPADMKRFDREIEILKMIHTTAWEQNWGNVPLSDAELEHLANDLKMIIDPELVLFLEHRGEPVGMAITVPDLNQVLARFNGRLLPFGIFHLLNRKRIIDRARLVMLGVLPEHRNRGYDLLLIHEVVKRARDRGIKGGECGWTLEDNTRINNAIEATGGVRNKTYRIFQKGL
ncbi:MAG TPA: GNAT family N-acetyltransferase [Trueperaceae bacterium]|nr:GNAT family N-acetyltransferase [Trueperaceae bacterium]